MMLWDLAPGKSNFNRDSGSSQKADWGRPPREGRVGAETVQGRGKGSSRGKCRCKGLGSEKAVKSDDQCLPRGGRESENRGRQVHKIWGLRM